MPQPLGRERCVQKEQDSHHMLLEIREEPVALRETLNAASSPCRKIASELAAEELGLIYFSGSGTSYHAALAGHYLMSSLTSKQTNSIPASEFDSWVRAPPDTRNVLFAISQSGESVDVLSAVSTAKRMGIRSVAVTNTPGSTLSKVADFEVVTRAGPEKALAATKSFLSCLALTYLLSLEIIDACGFLANTREALSTLRSELVNSPRIVQETLSGCEDQARNLANRFEHSSVFFLLGRGANYATALEGALKLKETCNVMAEGHAAREFLHGPLQLVDETTPVVVISTTGDYESLEPLSGSFRRLGAPILHVSEVEIARNQEEQLHVTRGLSEVLSPLAFIVPIQLFAYYSAVSRGLNPDKPTKLTKVVR
jgi:glucosamine--fructose-6-phosphate aminotransferase (isomerizing)